MSVFHYITTVALQKEIFTQYIRPWLYESSYSLHQTTVNPETPALWQTSTDVCIFIDKLLHLPDGLVHMLHGSSVWYNILLYKLDSPHTQNMHVVVDWLTNLWMHFFFSRYSMPAATFSVILTNVPGVRLWPSCRRKERKSPPYERCTRAFSKQGEVMENKSV